MSERFTADVETQEKIEKVLKNFREQKGRNPFGHINFHEYSDNIIHLYYEIKESNSDVMSDEACATIAAKSVELGIKRSDELEAERRESF